MIDVGALRKKHNIINNNRKHNQAKTPPLSAKLIAESFPFALSPLDTFSRNFTNLKIK